MRVSSNFNQIEWGARQDLTSDDARSLQNWLDWNQPHIATPGNAMIKEMLTCSNPIGTSLGNTNPYNGTIQGPPPIALGDGAQQPTFLITAVSGFSDTAMLDMTISPCAISGVGLIGANGAGYDIVLAEAKHNSVFNHSLLQGGNVGFHCQSAGADTEVLDSTISQSGSYGIRMGCPNSKIQRNIISGAGSNSTTAADGIHVTGSQALIEDNVIEQSGGSGIGCSGGYQLAIVGNYFDNNGKGTSGSSNLHLSGCQTTSVVGNQFHRGSAHDQNTQATAQIWLDGANDSISTSGNVYFTGATNPLNVQMRPDYVLELGTGASVTNFSFGDSPTPQNQGIFGPNAIAANLTPLASPVVPKNYITGLITQNNGTNFVQINGGTVADSSSIQLISVPAASPCNVTLSTAGVGGLDVGGSLAPATTYNFFVFSQGGNNGAAYCIASTSSSPNFGTAATAVGNPLAHVQVNGFISSTSNQIMNVTQAPCTPTGSPTNCPDYNPLGGLAVGDYIDDSGGLGYIASGTQITALNSQHVSFTGTIPSPGPGYDVSVSSLSGLYSGMVVGDVPGSGATGLLNGYSVIKYVQSTGTCGAATAPCFEMTNSANAGSESMLASGAFTITMSANPSNNSWNGTSLQSDTINVYNERYRLIASIATNSSSNIPAYHQNGDTSYLDAPVLDFNGTVMTSATTVTLGSVPNGIAVQAFGRCVGGNTGSTTHRVILYSPSQASLPGPSPFTTAPGYSINSLTPVTAFPFRAWTDTSRSLRALTDVSPSSLQCDTDGWVLMR